MSRTTPTLNTIRRMQKLRRLAQAPNAEGAVAMLRLREALIRYDLDETFLEDHEDVEIVLDATLRDRPERAEIEQAARERLAWAIAGIYKCYVGMIPSRGICLIGPRHAAETTRKVYAKLVASVETQCAKAHTEFVNRCTHGPLTSWHRDEWGVHATGETPLTEPAFALFFWSGFADSFVPRCTLKRATPNTDPTSPRAQSATTAAYTTKAITKAQALGEELRADTPEAQSKRASYGIGRSHGGNIRLPTSRLSRRPKKPIAPLAFLTAPVLQDIVPLRYLDLD